MTLLLNCSLPRDSMSQLTPSALSNASGAIHLELKQLLQVQSMRPKDAPLGPNPYSEALQIALLRKRIMSKNPPPPHNDFSNSTIGNVNLGTVLGDLNASVQSLQSHGSRQIADLIGKLTNGISNWTEIDDAHRKDLLENVAQV